MCAVWWGFFCFFSIVDGDKWWAWGQIGSTKHSKAPRAAWKQPGSHASLISALYLLRLSAGLDKCVSRCGRPPSPFTPASTSTSASTTTAQAVVSPSSELEPPAHVFTTRSNLGDIVRLRHGGRFDVCLLFPAIRELVSDPPSKLVFPDIPAEKKRIFANAEWGDGFGCQQ